MHIFYTISDLQTFLKDKSKIGFVPTMGYLHEGHLSLVKKSLKQNPCTVISIYVNPSQFNNKNDLKNYPRDEKKDLQMLKKILGQNDCVFLPNEKEINGYKSKSNNSHYRLFCIPSHLKNCLCGQTRPGHFEGVCEIITKFLTILHESSAFISLRTDRRINMYLGKKDYQQLKILESLIKSKFKNVRIIGCPIIREKNGLAMSSRNVRLDPKQRQIAVNLYKELLNAKQNLKTQNVKTDCNVFPFTSSKISNLTNQIISNLEKNPEIKIDYIEIKDANDLRKISKKTKKIIIAGAIFIKNIRLIDNILLRF